MIIPFGETRDTQSLVQIDKTETGINRKSPCFRSASCRCCMAG